MIMSTIPDKSETSSLQKNHDMNRTEEYIQEQSPAPENKSIVSVKIQSRPRFYTTIDL
jgi:hypothetical protein